MSDKTAAQIEFDEKYMTSSEMCELLGVHRSTLLHQRLCGRLPGAIRVRGHKTLIWVRDEIMPELLKWQEQLEERRAKREEVDGE